MRFLFLIALSLVVFGALVDSPPPQETASTKAPLLSGADQPNTAHPRNERSGFSGEEDEFEDEDLYHVALVWNSPRTPLMPAARLALRVPAMLASDVPYRPPTV